MADLFLICGAPGSGKSTFLKRFEKCDNYKVISRDKIRFSLLSDGENYFSHEDESLAILWKQINDALANGKTVFVDQTSLNPKARSYLINHVHGYNEVNAIWMNETLKTCLDRNDLRTEPRTKVPRGAVRRMFYSFVKPSYYEGFTHIYRYESETDSLIEEV